MTSCESRQRKRQLQDRQVAWLDVTVWSTLGSDFTGFTDQTWLTWKVVVYTCEVRPAHSLSIHWTCDLELSSSLCQAFVFTCLGQNWKPVSSLLHTDLSFSSHCTSQSPVMHVLVVCVCVCVCVCDEISLSLCLCKCSGLLRDGVPSIICYYIIQRFDTGAVIAVLN